MTFQSTRRSAVFVAVLLLAFTSGPASAEVNVELVDTSGNVNAIFILPGFSFNVVIELTSTDSLTAGAVGIKV